MSYWKILFMIMMIPIAYFSITGLGYGMTYTVVGGYYNMTSGCHQEDCDDMTICYNDQGKSFYGGCFFVGIICAYVATISLLMIYTIFICINNPAIPSNELTQLKVF